jgi:hypothetical protein
VTDKYQEAIEYERLVQEIYQAILKKEGQDIRVLHNVKIKGRSGVSHQVDVMWSHQHAGIGYSVIIECKNYKSNISLEKVRNIHAVSEDIRNNTPVVVTKTGYQSGAKEYAKFYGIHLKLLRKPTSIVKQFVAKLSINTHIKSVVSTEDKPIIGLLDIALNLLKPDQAEILEALQKDHPEKASSIVNSGPETVLYDSDGSQITEEFRYWVPKQLNVLEKSPGGPYVQQIMLDNHYIYADIGRGIELIKLRSIGFKYYVEQVDIMPIVLDAYQTVDAVLEDFNTGNIEYLHVIED